MARTAGLSPPDSGETSPRRLCGTSPLQTLAGRLELPGLDGAEEHRVFHVAMIDELDLVDGSVLQDDDSMRARSSFLTDAGNLSGSCCRNNTGGVTSSVATYTTLSGPRGVRCGRAARDGSMPPAGITTASAMAAAAGVIVDLDR